MERSVRLTDAADSSRALLRRPALVLGGILLIAFLVRIRKLGSESYWTDEYASLLSSNGYSVTEAWPALGSVPMPVPRLTQLQDARSLWAIPGALHSDNHPP